MPAILIIGLPIIFSQSWPFNDTDYKIIIFVSVIVGYFSLAIIGIPIVYWLTKMGKVNFINLSLSGAIAGAVVFSLFSIILGASLDSTTSLNLGSIIWGAALGLSVALTYSAISGITSRSTTTPKSGAVDTNR